MAQGLAITAADAGWIGAAVAWRAAIAATIGAVGLRGRTGRRVCACAALGAAAGYGIATNLEAAAAAPPQVVEATIEADVDAVLAQPDRVLLELVSVRGVEPPAMFLPGRLLLAVRSGHGAVSTPFAVLAPGDRVRARVRIRPYEARANPGGPDRERRAARRGIGARATLVHDDLLVRRPDADGWRPLAPVHRLRARASQRLAVEGSGGGLVRALALGDRGGLAVDRRDAFQRLGVSHLLAVSGLHLALASALAYRAIASLLVRWGGAAQRVDPRGAALLGAAAIAAGYALLAGFGVPVRRALVVLLGLAASLATRRPTRRGAPLVAAAVLVLAFEPSAWFEIGAWLSFAASAALVWAARAPDPDPDRGSSIGTRTRRACAELVGTTALASAATAPIAAASLGLGAPGYGVLANLVAIPWTALVLLPASIGTALVAGIAPESGFAAALCAGVAALGSRTLDALSAVAAYAPVLPAAPRGPGAIAAAGAVALLAVRVRSVPARLAASLVVAGILAAAPLPPIDPAPPRVVVLDVGQGDSVLVQGRTGTLLVDAGVAVPGGVDLGATVVVPALRALGVERLDLVVASHADLDHRGGLPAVLRAVPVARVWLPLGGVADPAFAEVVAAAHAAGAPVEERGAGGAVLHAGDLRIASLWPPPDDPGGSRNDRSLTLRIDVAGRSVLLPGDLEAAGEARLLAAGAPLRADVLKLGHHGSRTSSTAAWLAAVDGAVAVASAPRLGRFGMPHAEVVDRAGAAGYALWWTGRHGAVLIGLEPLVFVRGWR